MKTSKQKYFSYRENSENLQICGSQFWITKKSFHYSIPWSYCNLKRFLRKFSINEFFRKKIKAMRKWKKLELLPRVHMPWKGVGIWDLCRKAENSSVISCFQYINSRIVQIYQENESLPDQNMISSKNFRAEAIPDDQVNFSHECTSSNLDLIWRNYNIFVLFYIVETPCFGILL